MVVGMWQVSGGHGRIDAQAAVQAMIRHAELGYNAFDLADHYGPAEDFVGDFRTKFAQKHGQDKLQTVFAFTKWVPPADKMTLEVARKAINISLRRMRVACLDMLQFHWWDYGNTEYMNALRHLLTLQREGLIRHLALTNFDTPHLQEILDAGIPVVSNQVSYSMVDRRPENRMLALCKARGVKLLTYGTLLGGFLSDKWLGSPAPQALETVSQRKYLRFIQQWGGWELFQDLLRVVRKIADKHAASIANVACSYVLDQQEVAGVLVGSRLGLTDHSGDNSKVFSFKLDANDLALLHGVLNRGKMLPGDCGDEYRSG
jgi:aryl-alcohol dehydrogenase-like predicted oxidoreductase